MKKYIFGLMAIALCWACTQDEESLTSPDANLTLEDSFTAAENLLTATPNRTFDLSSQGLYQGVIVTEDAAFHGKIFINAGNDGNYNALVETDTKELVPFRATRISRSQEIIQFTGKRGSFIFDASRDANGITTDVVIDNTSGFIETVKDRSTQRATTMLGTYVDFADPAFTGTWDLITDGSPAINFVGTDLTTPIVLPLLTKVCFLGPGGNMFVDAVFEPFDYPCVGATGILPVFYSTDAANDPTDPTSANEFWAQNQILDVIGSPLNYFLGQSSVLSIANSFANSGFHQQAFDGSGALTCSAFTGLQGIWFWNGRVGSANFTDPFDFVPPPTVGPSNDVSENPLENPINTINSIDPSLISVIK